MNQLERQSLSQDETARLVQLLLQAGQGLDISENDILSDPNPVVQQIMAAILMLDEDLREKERQLAQSERQISILLDSVDAGVGVCDPGGQIFWANKTASQMYPGVETGRSFKPTSIPVPISTGTHRVSRIDAGKYLSITFSKTQWGDQSGYLFWIRDTSAVSNLKRGAINDPLTGLPNRVLFLDALSTALKQTDTSASQLSVVYMDLDGFKEINDEYGHLAGDEVLRIVAKRITSQLRSHDLVARIGGDEFAMIAQSVTPTEVGVITERIERTVAEPLHLDDVEVSVGVSIGVASSSSGGSTSPDELMDLADRSMLIAKNATRGSSRNRRRLQESSNLPLDP